MRRNLAMAGIMLGLGVLTGVSEAGYSQETEVSIIGTVKSITDLRPRELYPNYFATVTVDRVIEGTLNARQIRITDPADEIDDLKEGATGQFTLSGPHGGLDDTFTLIHFEGVQSSESGEGKIEPDRRDPTPQEPEREPETDDPALKAVYSYIKNLQKKQDDQQPEQKVQALKLVAEFKNDVIQATLPEHRFFSLGFPQHPVAFLSGPPPLQSNNLFAVPAKGDPSVTLMTSSSELQTFCERRLRGKDEASARAATHAYCLLREQLAQDGFYRFAIKPEQFKIEIDGKDRIVKAVMKVVPQGGNSGSIDMTLRFRGDEGRFLVVQEDEKLKPGMRPICQSLRLLDPDESVRAAAERDILLMGRNALPYLRAMTERTKGALLERILEVIRRIEYGE